MLKPAQLYESEIQEKYLGLWYNKEYMYYTTSPGMGRIEFPNDNDDQHCFASIGEDGEVIGIISYNINWRCKYACHLGILAFRKKSLTFMKDLRQAIEDIFFKYNLNRLEFYAVADNPAVPSYQRIVKKYGGVQSGYERECVLLIDGKLHDYISFEIMAKDFKEHYVPKKKTTKNKNAKIVMKIADFSAHNKNERKYDHGCFTDV